MGLSATEAVAVAARPLPARYPDPVRQVVVGAVEEMGLRRRQSDRDWLMLTPKVIGPQSANVLLEADRR